MKLENAYPKVPFLMLWSMYIVRSMDACMSYHLWCIVDIFSSDMADWSAMQSERDFTVFQI